MAYLISLVALVVAGIGLIRIQRVERRLDQLADELARSAARGETCRPPDPTETPRADVAALARKLASASLPPTPAAPRKPFAPAPRAAAASGESQADAAPAPSTPPPPAGWEEKIGTRVAVWLAAVALALAGAYLVKYSFDNDLIRPGVRVALGVGFGLALLLAAQPLHRRLTAIAAAIAAAGIAVLFACVLASTRLYGFLGPVSGFLVMAVVAGTAVALSLRHGRLVAVVGLSGGFITPALIGAGVPDARLTFGYLFLLQVGLIAVTRRLGWWVMALLTLFGSLAWSGTFLVLIALDRAVAASAAWLGTFVLATTASFIFAGWSTGRTNAWGSAAIGRLLTWLSTVMAMFLLATLIGVDSFATADWLMLGLLVAGVMALARFRGEYLAMAWMVATGAVMMLAVWAAAMDVDQATRWLAIAAFHSALLTAGAWALMWRSGREPPWAVLGCAAPVAVVLIARSTGVALPDPAAWWLVACGLAGIIALLSVWATAWRRHLDAGDTVLAMWFTSAAALLAIAAALGLDRIWIGPAWAALSLLMVGLAGRLSISRLLLSAQVIAVAAACQTVLDPAVYHTPLAPTVVINQLAAAQVAVVVLLVGAAVLRRRQASDDRWFPGLVEAAAWCVLATAAALQVRHGFASVDEQSGMVDLLAGGVRFWEAATYVVAWAALAIGFLVVGRRLAWASVRLAGPLVAGLAAAAAVGLLLLVYNPLFVRADLGDMALINGLTYGYALPAALAGAIAWLTRHDRDEALSPISGGAAIVLLLVWITFEVRRLFHPVDMTLGPDGRAAALEWASYVNLWLGLGLAAIAMGRRLQRRMPVRVGLGLSLLGAVAAITMLGLARNPLLHAEPVGEPTFLNWLLAMYAAPALLAAAAGRWLPTPLRPARSALYAAALLLLFGFVSLEVRQYYHGNVLNTGETSPAEWYTYSAAWVALGVTLLVAGALSGNRSVRYASLAIMALAVVKVFFSDTAHLENLYRVLSFLGLGVSLLVLAFVYQRFVFHRRPLEPPPPQR